MSLSPVIVAWTNLTTACSFVKERQSFQDGLKASFQIVPLFGLVAWQIMRMTLRSVTSIMVLMGTLILGGILGYFCFLGGTSAVGMFFKGALATHLLDARSAVAASQDVMKVSGVSSLFSVGFLAWKRWPEFAAAIRAAWRWVWVGGLEETRGLVGALSKQLVVYAGLFFAVFVLFSMAKNGPPPVIVEKKPADLADYRTVMSEVLDTRIESLRSIVTVDLKSFRDQLAEWKTESEARAGLLVYLDKSRSYSSPRPRFDLIYVAFFHNASFAENSNQGRVLGSAEKTRLVNFAESLRHIAQFGQSLGDLRARLRIEVRGFASEAPKGANLHDKEQLNVRVANDRARSVHSILRETLKDVTVDLVDPIVWKEGTEMRVERQYDDKTVLHPAQAQTALAEAPNRRVEILVNLPDGLRFQVSDVAGLSTVPR